MGETLRSPFGGFKYIFTELCFKREFWSECPAAAHQPAPELYKLGEKQGDLPPGSSSLQMGKEFW